MIEIVQAPKDTKLNGITIFLAGGISNCPNWQAKISNKIEYNQTLFDLSKKYSKNIIVYNPRCETRPEETPQIIWEFERLEKSNIISFWFSGGSVNPITLFEYGAHFKNPNKKIIVGCDPTYERKVNVILQTKLAMPNLKVFSNIDDFYDEIIDELIIKLEEKKKRKWRF